MAKIQDIDIPHLEFAEGAAPGTPASAITRIYAKADGLMYSKDDAGTETLMSSGPGGGAVATDTIWDAAGDLVQGTGANTAAKLGAGTAGQFLKSGGAAAANAWASRELDYVAFTSPVSITATTEGTANTVVTGSAVTYDGSTAVIVEFFSPEVNPQLTDGVILTLVLFEDSTVVGVIAKSRTLNNTTTVRETIRATVRRTPAAGSKTMIVKAFTTSGTSVVGAGAGGTGALVAGYIRVTRAV